MSALNNFEDSDSMNIPAIQTNKRLSILFLAHKIPYPPNKGDRIPTYHRVKFLAERHKISLVFPCFYKEELKYVDELKKYCASVDTVLINPLWAKFKALFYILSRTPLTLPYFYSFILHKKIFRRIKEEKFDLIYVYSSSMGQYVLNVRNIPKIIDFADIDSHKWLQYAKHTLPPHSLIYYLEWLKLRRYEQLLSRKFEHSVVISENEKNIFCADNQNKEASVVANGVDYEYFKPNPAPYDPKRIVFLGAMDYFANVDGVLYFYKKILPLIRKEVSDIKFYIVGSRPAQAISQLKKDKNVTVTGFVEDVRPYLKSSCVSIVPLRIAQGLQNKVLEAMAMGVPVVSTSQAIKGIGPEIGKEVLCGDNDSDFAHNVIALIKNQDLRQQIGQNGRRLVETKYSWNGNLQKLENIILEAAHNGVKSKVENILTVDVEDWFHICGVSSIGDINCWEKYESRIKDNLKYLLNILDDYNAKGTFFILGWIAERFPEIISEIERRGHEIATHGYAHELVYEQTPKEFAVDLEKSLRVLSAITKQKILGYRAPSFSITKGSLWALDILSQHGLQYDSSVFPTTRTDGGLPGAQIFPYRISLHNGNKLWEFPVSVMHIFKFRLVYSGGGYFRLIPYSLIKSEIQRANKKGRPSLVYLHPREIDVGQPRLPMPWKRRFKCYVNIQHTESKLRRLLCDFSFTTCRDILDKIKC